MTSFVETDPFEPMGNRPPSKFLEELGWLAICWSQLEAVVEMSCVYLFKAGLVKAKDGKPPKPFGARIKFIRRGLSQPIFTHLRTEYELALRNALTLANERNDRIHGTYTAWEKSNPAFQTVIKSDDNGYIAILDIEISERALAELSRRIIVSFATLFNLMDRMKTMIRAVDGKEDLGRRMKLNE